MTTHATDNQQRHTDTRRQNMEQKRGGRAWSNIEFIKNKNNDTLQSEYRTRASQLNAMIQTNGLGQTLGFLKAKGKEKDDKGRVNPNAYYHLLMHLTQWMRNISFDPAIPDSYDGLLKWITQTASSADYRRATTECLAFGTWLRRFAEAELKAPKNSGVAVAATVEAPENAETAAPSEEGGS